MSSSHYIITSHHIIRAPKEFIVNLDLPQEERWKEIGEKYADKSFLLVEYLRRNLPRGWLKPIEAIAGKLLPFFRDYGGEIKEGWM